MDAAQVDLYRMIEKEMIAHPLQTAVVILIIVAVLVGLCFLGRWILNWYFKNAEMASELANVKSNLQQLNQQLQLLHQELLLLNGKPPSDKKND
jgi:hypothetical protein